MKWTEYRLGGICLIIGSLLMVLTMVLHPTGGSIQHIVKIADIAIWSHGIAIFSVPCIAFGFFMLSSLLSNESKLSYLAFSFIAFGLMAVLIAAAYNGIILPLFAIKYQHAPEADLSMLNPIIKYGLYVNAAMDYIFIGACTIAMAIWSGLIIRSGKLHQWIGYLGCIVVSLACVGFIWQLNFISVTGFRIYIFSIVTWILWTGYKMTKV